MKPIATILLFFLPFCSIAQQAKIDTNFHIYLLMGQSNMAGRGVLDEKSLATDKDILMLDKSGTWQIACDPVHFDKPAAAGVGPGISFAKNLKGNSKVRIGLVPCALGGSPISVWKSGSIYLKTFHPYDDAIARAKLAMQYGVIKGVIWHQGESDNDSLKASIYLDKLKILINSLRKDLEQPTLPFVAGEIGTFNKVNWINRIINLLPKEVSNTAVVSSNGLTDKGDHLHFDSPSARILGERYAHAMRDLQLAIKNKTFH